VHLHLLLLLARIQRRLRRGDVVASTNIKQLQVAVGERWTSSLCHAGTLLQSQTIQLNWNKLPGPVCAACFHFQGVTGLHLFDCSAFGLLPPDARTVALHCKVTKLVMIAGCPTLLTQSVFC